MQTFLPYPDFADSARVLDRQRLGKERVEVLQILRTLTGVASGWSNHPAVKMWRGHERALGCYGIQMCWEWQSRGYKDTCEMKILELTRDLPKTGMPAWLGNEEFHASHRANLLRKDPEHYGSFGWTEDPTMDYVWPR